MVGGTAARIGDLARVASPWAAEFFVVEKARIMRALVLVPACT